MHHQGDRSLFRRVSLQSDEQAMEKRKRDEVLRILDKGDYGHIIVHKYKGRIVQIQERWDHRFPKSMNLGMERRQDRGGYPEREDVPSISSEGG